MMKKFYPFLTMWLVNTALLWWASNMYPTSFVLGTFRMNALVSALVAAFVWTLAIYNLDSFAKKIGFNMGKGLVMMVYYFLGNFVTLWVVTRMAPLCGFGVSSFTWLIALAFIANLLQYGVWVLMVKLKLAKE